MFDEPRGKLLCPLSGDTGQFSELLGGDATKGRDAVEASEEKLLATGSHSRARIESAFAHSFAHEKFVVIVRKTVRFITQPLQQTQRPGIARQYKWLVAPGKVDLLIAFRQSHHRHFPQSNF